jgi:hypothetical protein
MRRTLADAGEQIANERLAERLEIEAVTGEPDRARGVGHDLNCAMIVGRDRWPLNEGLRKGNGIGKLGHKPRI